MHPGRLLLVRHGQTAWSLAGRHTGRTDIPLTPEGRQTMADLAPLLQDWKAAACWSSPLQRAWDTAGLIGLMPQAEPDLLEWDYGAYEGITSAQIQTERAAAGEPPWSLWDDGCPGGEDASAVGARVDRVLARVRSNLPGGESVVLVAHGHVLRVLAARWLQLPPRQGALFMLDAGRTAILDHEHGVPALASWNAIPPSRPP